MTYVFDIDGTICSHTYGSYDEAKPDVERIKKVNELYDEGSKISQAILGKAFGRYLY